jgi:NitT/TauT family transport system substrate-binding protein
MISRKSFIQLLAATLLTSASTFAAAQTTVRVNYIPIVDVTPLFVAIDKGYFAAEGLTITPTPSAGGAAGIPGLMAGAFDVMYGNIVSTALAEEQGFKLRIISAATKQFAGAAETTGLMARHGDNIKTGKDLEGKTVAVNTRNGVIWLFARSWVTATGGDASKVVFKEVQFPQMLDALRGKQIDAAFMVSPFYNAAAANPAAFDYVGSPYSVVQPGLEVGQYVSTQAYAAKNAETLGKFTRALRKGTQWYNANLTSPDLVRIIAGFTKMQPELVAKLSLQVYPETVDPAVLEKTVKLMKDNGLLTTDVDVRAMIGPEALK